MSDSSVIPWTVAYQAPLSMGFSSQEYWSGLPPKDLPHPRIEPVCPALAGRFFTTAPPGNPKLERVYLPTCSNGKGITKKSQPKLHMHLVSFLESLVHHLSFQSTRGAEEIP